MAAFHARPYLTQAATTLGIGSDEIIWLLDSEILQGLEGRPIPTQRQIALRQRSFGIVNDGKDQKVIVGMELEKWVDALIPKPQSQLLEIKGISASPGIVEGVACVALTPHEAQNIQAGQILVAPQTTPDFVPFMRKAGAIVTDEGGLTCHAAIISRELGKPCVVGTKVATQIIRNGERILVNADIGLIVRLVK